MVTGHLAAWALSSLTSKLSPMEEAGRTGDSQGKRLDQSQAEQEAAHTSNTGTWASVGGSGGHHNYHCIYLHHSHLCICTQITSNCVKLLKLCGEYDGDVTGAGVPMIQIGK